jgi:hypothetical protein
VLLRRQHNQRYWKGSQKRRIERLVVRTAGEAARLTEG